MAKITEKMHPKIIELKLEGKSWAKIAAELPNFFEMDEEITSQGLSQYYRKNIAPLLGESKGNVKKIYDESKGAGESDKGVVSGIDDLDEIIRTGKRMLKVISDKSDEHILKHTLDYKRICDPLVLAVKTKTELLAGDGGGDDDDDDWSLKD